MESITIYPETVGSCMSEEEFYAKIDHAIRQAEEGDVKTLSKEDQKDFLGL